VLLVGFGIAASASLLAAIQAGSLIAQDRSVAHSVAEIDPSVRAVRAVWLGVPSGTGEGYGSLDRLARQTLGATIGSKPAGAVLYRESTIAGSFIALGAVDGLAPWLRLRSGRLPRRCRPERCEVVQLRGSGLIPDAPGLRLIRVGRAELVSDLLFGDAIEPVRSGRAEAELSPAVQRARRYHRPAPPPFLLAEGVAGLSGSPELDTVYRSYSWVTPLEPELVHPWTIEPLSAGVERARATLLAQSASFDLTAPLQELAFAGTRAELSGRRLLLLGGQAAALLLAFAVLAAARLRRDYAAAWRRLTWLGAKRWQMALLTVSETTVAVLLGTVVGWAVGAVAGASVARAAGSPAWGVLRHSVLSSSGVALAALVGVGAVLVIVATLALRPLRVGRLTVSSLDVAAVGALAVLVVAVGRGKADQGALARESGTGVLLLVTPALTAFVAAVACARLFAPALQRLERIVPRNAIGPRLAVLSLARRPGHAAVTIAFLVVSVGLALFAETYRSTLVRGQKDAAAFAVPVDVILREDLSRLIPVHEAAPPARLRALGADVAVQPVLRLSSSATGRVEATGITVLGLDAQAIPALEGWREDFAEPTLAQLARRIEPRGPVDLRGVSLSSSARRLELRASVRGPDVSVVAFIAAKSGRVVAAELGMTDGPRPRVLTADLSREARGGTVIALRLDPPPRIVERGADAGKAAQGMLLLDDPLGRFRGWVGVDGARRVGGEGPVRVRYSLTSQRDTYFRSPQPTDGTPVAVLVAGELERLAGEGGLLPIQVGGQRLVTRVVGSAERFPGSKGAFVVADRQTLVTALNAGRPGSAVPNEFWIESGPKATAARVEEALRRPPFDLLERDSRREREALLRDEPIARGSLVMLVAAAIVALVLALLGLVLGVRIDLRDERAELFDLEAQGADPAALRRQIRLRSLVVSSFGLTGGIIGGALLGLLVVRLVSLTASATAPEPPLVPAASLPVVGLALASLAVLAVALVAAASAGAFRSATPDRSPEALP